MASVVLLASVPMVLAREPVSTRTGSPPTPTALDAPAATNRAVSAQSSRESDLSAVSPLSPLKPLVESVGIDQHLGDMVPLDLTFTDEQGQVQPLRSYFGDRPVILTLVYYKCPMLCTQVLNGLLKSMQGMTLQVGRDFDVVTISIDPGEGPALALEKKQHYVRRYRREGAEEGWHFLTGSQVNIAAICQAVGYRYAYDPRTAQFAHASGLMIATPDGRLSRYHYGIDYSPRDLQLGLVESSQRRIGSPVDQILLMCFHYDPHTGRYGLAVANALRLGGSMTVLSLVSFMVVMIRRERRQLRQGSASGLPPGEGTPALLVPEPSTSMPRSEPEHHG